MFCDTCKNWIVDQEQKVEKDGTTYVFRPCHIMNQMIFEMIADAAELHGTGFSTPLVYTTKESTCKFHSEGEPMQSVKPYVN